MPRTLHVGLTGGLASGKSTLAGMLVERGARLIDTDAIARELTAAGGAAIAGVRAAFGDDAIAPDGAMDRARMRSRVFADPRERHRLEAILHPLIGEQCRQRAAHLAPGGGVVLVDIPLLAETGALGGGLPLDRVLVVDCPAAVQLARAVARGMDPHIARAVIAAQASRGRRLDVADDVVFNGGSPQALRAHAARLWTHYEGRCAV